MSGPGRRPWGAQWGGARAELWGPWGGRGLLVFHQHDWVDGGLFPELGDPRGGLDLEPCTHQGIGSAHVEFEESLSSSKARSSWWASSSWLLEAV